MKHTEKWGRKLSVLELAKEGISIADITASLKGDWELYPIVHEILGISRYYTLKWNSKYFLSIIKDGRIYSQQDMIHYTVCYNGCNPLEISQAESVRLSFRASHYGNYVLVQIARNTSERKGN